MYSSFPANFDGEQIDANAILVKYTFAGDATFDGKVNTLDFNVLAGNFGGSDKTFAQGDFDHSGVVDSIDFGILLGQYGQSVPAPASPPAAPSPAGALFGDLEMRQEKTLDVLSGV